MIDYTKISSNENVISLIKEMEFIEQKIRETDEKALLRYQLEILNQNALCT